MNNQKTKINATVKFVCFVLILIFIFLVAIKYVPDIIVWIKNPTNVREYMLSIGIFGYLLHVLLLIVHVVLVVIPGDIFYVLGGFAFGLPMGFILSYLGVLTGGFIVFCFSHLLGYDFVKRIVPKRKLEKANSILNSTKGLFGLFIICIIPIFPKSTIMYALGLTPIKPLKLFSVYALSRIPVIFMWTAVGSNAYEKNYVQMIIIIGLLIVSALMGYYYFKKNNKKIETNKNVS